LRASVFFDLVSYIPLIFLGVCLIKRDIDLIGFLLLIVSFLVLRVATLEIRLDELKEEV